MATGALIVSLVITAAAAYKQNQQAHQAAAARKKANQVASAEASVRRQQDIRDQIRAERIKRAQILQASRDTGVYGSSGESGAISSLSSQIGSNIGNITRQGNTATSIANYQQSAADAMGRAATFGQISSLSMGVASGIFNNSPSAQKNVSELLS